MQLIFNSNIPSFHENTKSHSMFLEYLFLSLSSRATYFRKNLKIDNFYYLKGFTGSMQAGGPKMIKIRQNWFVRENV